MDPSEGHVVLDISSDEEGLVSDVPKGSDSGIPDWFIQRLWEDDPMIGDSEEVVVVKEVNAKSKSNELVTDDDDDCVVLDGDPEKLDSVPDDAVDGGADDLLIVGEKGQVACRDYPHPRHDCVIFPFSSTLHDKHCNLCHCYVCDSPAPCAYWGEGFTDADHCHANDKQEKWKVRRKDFMQGKSTPKPVSNFLPDPVSMVLPQPTQALPPINTQTPTNSIPQNLVSRPMIFRPCSSPTRSSSPSNIQYGRMPHARPLWRGRFQPISSSGQLHRAHHVIQKDRGHRDSYLGPHLVPPIVSHKRTGTVGSSLAVSRAACCPNSINYIPYLPSSTNSIHNTIVNQNDIRRQNSPSSLNLASSINLNSCSPDLIGVSSSMASSQASSDGQGSNQSVGGQNIYQHQSQPSVLSSFPDSLSKLNEFLQADDSPLSPPAVENTHVPSTDHAHEAQPAREFNPAVDIGAAGLGFENWWLENPHPENNFPPVPAAVDAGMLLFDFETSWNSVTQS